MSSRLLPPQSPCSEQDVASYSQLVIHLRSQPELARENEKLLNAEALADLTEGVRQFQHAHLGRVSGIHVISRSEHVSDHERVVQFHAVSCVPQLSVKCSKPLHLHPRQHLDLTYLMLIPPLSPFHLPTINASTALRTLT